MEIQEQPYWRRLLLIQDWPRWDFAAFATVARKAVGGSSVALAALAALMAADNQFVAEQNTAAADLAK